MTLVDILLLQPPYVLTSTTPPLPPHKAIIHDYNAIVTPINDKATQIDLIIDTAVVP